MTAYWVKDEHADDYDSWINGLLENAPESYDDDVAVEAIVSRYVHDLEEALDEVRKVVAFAYGFASSSQNPIVRRLTWLYAPDSAARHNQ